MVSYAALLVLALGALAYAQGPEKRRTGNVCDADMDCPDNAFCKARSYCVCKESFVYAAVNATTKACLKEATIGEDCVQHIQCHTKLGLHSECTVDRVCACNSNAHLENERCYETAVVGDRCISDENCYIGDRSVAEFQIYCIRGYCTCNLSFSPRDMGTRCVADAALNERCEDDIQCAGAGLGCVGNTCKCRDGWVASDYHRACLEAVRVVNGSCDYDVQCSKLAGTAEAPSPGAALCLGGVCACAHDAKQAGSPPRCWLKKRPGQECNRDEECSSEEDDPGYCLNGRCTCDNCTPDMNDFGAAASIKHSPIIVALAVALLAVLRH